MEQNEVLLSNIKDKISRCIDNFVLTSSDFLDAYEMSYVFKSFSRLDDCIIIPYGKKDDFERGMAVFVPSFLDLFSKEDLDKYYKDNVDEDPITCIKIKKDRFSSLTHRDYLGALMGLGIERKMIGDIDVVIDGAFVFVQKKMAQYICENLSSVGRGSVICEIVNDCPYNENKNIDEMTSTVSSLRLDNIVSLCFNLSRTKAQEAIKSGLVFQNSVQSDKIDRRCVEGDKVVFRSKGKIVIKEIVGKSKKDRYIIKINRYI